jgi:hypothetical protein
MSMSYDDGFGRRARRFLSETFGFRGSKNVTAWLLAGAAAYYLFYLPEKQRVLEIQVGCCCCCCSCACRSGCSLFSMQQQLLLVG